MGVIIETKNLTGKKMLKVVCSYNYDWNSSSGISARFQTGTKPKDWAFNLIYFQAIQTDNFSAKKTFEIFKPEGLKPKTQNEAWQKN